MGKQEKDSLNQLVTELAENISKSKSLDLNITID